MQWPEWIKNNTTPWIIGTVIATVAMIIPFLSFNPTPKTDDHPIQIHSDGNMANSQKPVINGSDDAPQAVVDRLLKKLDNTFVALQDKNSKLQKMVRKYKVVEARLAQYSDTDDVAAKARELLQQGDLDGAEALFSQRLEKPASQQKQAASDAFELASIADIKLNYDKAKTHFRQAAQLEPDNSLYLSAYGSVLNALGQYGKAIEYYGKALAIDLKVLGDKHPKIASSYNNLALAWGHKGRYDKVIEYYGKALAINLEVLGDKHPKVARSYNSLGLAWDDKGQYDKAIEYYSRALTIDLGAFSDEYTNIAIRFKDFGLIWDDKGQYDKAIEYYGKALAINLEVFGDKHPMVARNYNNLALAWGHKDQYDRAIEYYGKALVIFELALGPDHPQTLSVRNNLQSVRKR